VFALPWALLATVLAAAGQPTGVPYPGQVILIVTCMVLARTVAMSANRLIDATLDLQNPRTARRAIPAGRLRRSFVTGAIVVCSGAFVAATAAFGWLYANWLPLIFSAPVLLIISAYPFLKRFTQMCHYYLGACLALAPVCAWIAIAGNLDATPFLMAGAVLCWTAGFDIIYACQDYQSDRQTGVLSVPSRIGIGPALWVARLTHLLCLLLLLWLGLHVEQFATLYWVAFAVAAILLMVEHSLVKAHDLSKVNLAFFTVNGVISLVIGTLGIIDIYV
jgi:4-hydroxybenzoate polyprenyltransferase